MFEALRDKPSNNEVYLALPYPSFRQYGWLHRGYCNKERNLCLNNSTLSHIQGHYPFSSVATRSNKIPIVSSFILASKGANSGTNIGQNYLYSLATCQESEASTNVVTSMFSVFSRDGYYYLIWALSFLM